MVRLLFTASFDYTTTLNYILVGLGVIGFLAATVVGSVAWYNSKKPAGWEDAESPDWVPKITSETPQKSALKQ